MKENIGKIDLSANDASWDITSKTYNNVSWVNEKNLLDKIKDLLLLDTSLDILEVGCGTGVVARHLVENVKHYAGLDSSKEMLKIARKLGDPKMHFFSGDALKMPFSDNVFNRVLFRSVLHHFIDTHKKAVDESKRVLSRGGLLLIAEGGIPFDDDCFDDLNKILSEKEPNRIVFTEKSLDALLDGFEFLIAENLYIPDFSVDNWINNTVQEYETRQKIKQLHIKSSKHYKEMANMQFKENGDITVTSKWRIIVGMKHD